MTEIATPTPSPDALPIPEGVGHAPGPSAASDAWRDLSDLPRDATVLVVVEPTEANKCRSRYLPQTLPAYVDEHGRFCCPGTWAPDLGLSGPSWRVTLWQPLPQPRLALTGER